MLLSVPSSHKPTLAGVKSIAVFRALQLGDMICAIPAIRAIKKAYPESPITLIGLPWAQHFVKRFPQYFSDFIVFPGWPGLPEQKYTPSEIVRFLATVQEKKFDLIFQMQGEGTIANPLCMLLGANKVCGLYKEGSYCPDPELFVELRDTDHEIERLLKVAEAAGASDLSAHLEFPILAEEFNNYGIIKETLQLNLAKYVCIHPGARDPQRRWPANHFAFIGNELAAQGFKIVLTGGSEEKELLGTVAALMHHPVIDLTKYLRYMGIGELAAIIHDAGILISNDTGVSHIAAALKTPSVIIFSPYSDPERWAPLDSDLHTRISPADAQDPQKVLKAVLDHVEEFNISVV